MRSYASIPAAQPHQSPNTFSAQSLSGEERNGSGKRPFFYGTQASSNELRWDEHPQPSSEKVTSVQRESTVSYPAFARSLLRGLSGALRLGVVLLWLRHPFRVSVPPKTSL